MPGKYVTGAPDEPCRRCRDNASVLVVRSEPLCHGCFARYVHTKAIKRLEGFKVNFATAQDEKPKILLPISFGVSSTTLLHILNIHLSTQRTKTGRTGFSIFVLHVEDGVDQLASAGRLERIRAQYPDHEYASLPLHDVFHLLSEDSAFRALLPLTTEQLAKCNSQEQLAHMISSLPSATARADVVSTLRARLIVEHAKRTACKSVLWGDSTTRLAEKTLAETAKGRGFSLPWHVSDGLSPFGLKFHYPLRDILKRELLAYIELSESSLASLVDEPTPGAVQTSMSSKTTTIDDLMKQYFESVEENFPSIVSNVVRTTGKLDVPTGVDRDPKCSLCGMPVADGRFGIHRWGGDQHQDLDTPDIDNPVNLCYGCTRSMPGAGFLPMQK